MSSFPRTSVEHLSLPRLIIGTNWFHGYSHTSRARDAIVRDYVTTARIADIVEVFLRAGVDAVYGLHPTMPHVVDGVREAEQRVGRRCIRIAIPSLNVGDDGAARAENEKTLDAFKAIGTDIFMPHQSTTDALLSHRTRSLPGMERFCRMIRERGMVPGLSTHAPQTLIYADETDLDVATYIQIYNAAGFLMPVEADWVHRVIWESKHPVITIKPLAAGRLLPLVGMSFVWSTLRKKDMVCVGVMSADEAREIIDVSLMLLEGRGPTGELQATRSKESLQRR